MILNNISFTLPNVIFQLQSHLTVRQSRFVHRSVISHAQSIFFHDKHAHINQTHFSLQYWSNTECQLFFVLIALQTLQDDDYSAEFLVPGSSREPIRSLFCRSYTNDMSCSLFCLIRLQRFSIVESGWSIVEFASFIGIIINPTDWRRESIRYRVLPREKSPLIPDKRSYTPSACKRLRPLWQICQESFVWE